MSEQKNIQTLVNFNHDINEKISIFNQAPIHKIIESDKENKHEVLKNMLEMGSDPNSKDSNGWTALHYACELGDKESVDILLNHHSEINSYSNHKKTPLHLACYNGFTKIVEALLSFEPDQKSEIKDEKVNLDAVDKDNCTPLHLACKQGNTDCAKLLLDHKADLYALDFRDWNVLHYAAFYGHKNTVNYLCQFDVDYDNLINHTYSKIDVFSQEVDRKTKFSKDSKYDFVDKNTKERKLRLQKVLPIQIIRDPSIKPAFITIWHAAKEGDLDKVKNLLIETKNKVKNQTSEKKGNTPLHYAVLNNHYNLVRLLVVDYKVDVNTKNKEGMSPVDISLKMYEKISEKIRGCEDRNKETIDLRDVVKDFLQKDDERFIDVAICKSNWKLPLWKAFDFSEKIKTLLKDEQQSKSKSNVKNE